MRVLLEYNGRRVDIKDPVSNRAGRPDNSNTLKDMVNQALQVIGLDREFIVLPTDSMLAKKGHKKGI